MNRLLNLVTPLMLSVLRITTALTFLSHGTAKLLGFPDLGRPAPAMMSLSWTAGVLELVGGVLLTIGLFTRPVAFILSGLMAFAFFIAHFPRGYTPIGNAGEPAYLFCFIFLYLAFAGGGPIGVDALRGGGAGKDAANR
jgi:putative oxidoreductase